MSGDGKYVTTGEAARRLGVTPDTVLKWIHRGKIRAVATAGGHNRIEMGELRRMLGGPAEEGGRGERCWEYFSEGGAVRAACLECATYRFQASRCYIVCEEVGVGCGAARLSQGACGACPYYRREHGLKHRVLVVSRDEGWRAEVLDGLEDEVEVEFAGGVYEAAAVVGVFLPGSVVLDGELPADELEMLTAALRSDRRIPWVRVVVAAGEARGRGLLTLVGAEDTQET